MAPSHAAVHSLKDLPGITPPALGLAAVLPRADTADLLISRAPADARRAFRPARGSAPAASAAAGRSSGSVPGWRSSIFAAMSAPGFEKLTALSLDAIVLARAGLDRLGYTIHGGILECDAGAFHVSPLDILPAIGQGAIGIETRRDDAARARPTLRDRSRPHPHLHPRRAGTASPPRRRLPAPRRRAARRWMRVGAFTRTPLSSRT